MIFSYGVASRQRPYPVAESGDNPHRRGFAAGGHESAREPARIEGCWELCVRTALERHGGKLEVRLTLPDLVPLPLRLRKAVLAPLSYSYLHRELRLVRDFDLRMAREARCKLEEIPGWWEDERIIGTPLVERLAAPAEPARAVLGLLRPEPWL